MPKPTTCVQSCCTEASRAAALASHSAASLAAAAGFHDAARLLRSSEALARAATAVLLALPELHAGGAGAGNSAAVPDAKLKKKRIRKKKAKLPAMENATDGPEVLPPADGVPEATLAASASAMSPAAAVFVVPNMATRLLAKKSSRERSPRGARLAPAPATPPATTSQGTSPVSAGTAIFAVGLAVVLVDLVSRPDLSRMTGVVKAFDPATLRYAVLVDATGESVRVLGKNIQASISDPGFG